MSAVAERKFRLGKIIIAESARAFHENTAVDLGALMERHACGDWGDIAADEQAQNDLGVARGQPLLSVYKVGPENAGRVYITTEFDPHYTMVHGPMPDR